MAITIVTKPIEGFEEDADGNARFVNVPSKKFKMEHSLRAIARWEAIWKEPFLNRTEPLTNDMLISYLQCMNFDNEDFDVAIIDNDNIKKISDYISDKQSATIFTNTSPDEKPQRGKIVTSEEIYAQMFLGQVPIECEQWHINRLLMTLQAMKHLQGDTKKMTQKETMLTNHQINQARRAAMKSKG